MNTLDLFRDFTPDEIEILVKGSSRGRKEHTTSEETRRKIGEGIRKVWRNMSPDEHHRRSEANSQAQLKCWANKTEEERRVLSEAKSNYWASLSPGRKQDHLERSFHSKEARDKGRISRNNNEAWRNSISRIFPEYWASLGEEKKKEIYRRRAITLSTTHENLSPEARQTWNNQISEGQMRYLLGLTQEERLRLRRRITSPELFLGLYLEERFPDTWIYNGHGVYQEDLITLGYTGTRIPDFFRKTGQEIIEVFGTYWHSREDEEVKIAHYREFGFDCRVVWELDCFLWNELDRIFSPPPGRDILEVLLG